MATELRQAGRRAAAGPAVPAATRARRVRPGTRRGRRTAAGRRGRAGRGGRGGRPQRRPAHGMGRLATDADRPPQDLHPGRRDLACRVQGGGAGRPRTLEGPPSRARRVPRAAGHPRRRDARPIGRLVPRPGQPDPRPGGDAAGPGAARIRLRPVGRPGHRGVEGGDRRAARPASGLEAQTQESRTSRTSRIRPEGQPGAPVAATTALVSRSVLQGIGVGRQHAPSDRRPRRHPGTRRPGSRTGRARRGARLRRRRSRTGRASRPGSAAPWPASSAGRPRRSGPRPRLRRSGGCWRTTRWRRRSNRRTAAVASATSTPGGEPAGSRFDAAPTTSASPSRMSGEIVEVRGLLDDLAAALRRDAPPGRPRACRPATARRRGRAVVAASRARTSGRMSSARR